MSIFLTTQVSYATKVEAFNIRGLSNQVAVRACDAGIYPITKSALESRIRYGNMRDELVARVSGKVDAYTNGTIFTNILPKFDRFQFEGPTLFVTMKSGGEVLNVYGMFETATAKMGTYAGKPSSEHMKQIMTLGLEIYDNVPAGNVNIAGYCAYIQAWRGINAFFYMGGGDNSKIDILAGGVSKRLVDQLHEYFSKNPNEEGRSRTREGHLETHL